MKWKLILSALICTLLLPAAASAEEYWVDANAPLSKNLGTAEEPFKTIQKACDTVNPGDTVYVNPGVYYESVELKRSGTKEAPIVFKAVDSGENKTIITCANRSIRENKVQWRLEDANLQLYSIPYDRKVTVVMHDGAVATPYLSLEELKAYEGWPGGVRDLSSALPGPEHGFYWDPSAKKLYVRLGPEGKFGSSDPAKALMAVGGPYYDYGMVNGASDNALYHRGIDKDSYTFGILTENDAYVTLYGFTFETPGYCGVFCRASNVTVSNCWFKGCVSGVFGGKYASHDAFRANDVTVEYCDWNLWPLFTDSFEAFERSGPEYLYPYKWWFYKDANHALINYEQGTFVTYAGSRWDLNSNHIYECFDALSMAFAEGTFVYLPQYGTNKTVDPGGYIKIRNNRFENCIDNAIEVENHAHDVDIYDNEFVICFLPFSWQPLDGKPWPTNITVHNNVFHTEAWLIDMCWERGGGYPVEWLKWGANVSQWSRGPIIESSGPLDPATNQPAERFFCADKGCMIYNNTVYLPQGYTSEVVGLMTDTYNGETNVWIMNNIIYCRCQPTPQLVRMFIPSGQFVNANGVNGWIHDNNAFIASNPDVQMPEKIVNGGFGFGTMEEAGVSFDGFCMYLTEDSPLRGKGFQIKTERRDTTDMGAVPFGKVWHIEYGPRPEGDANCDKAVDAADLMQIGKLQGKVKGDDGYNSRCDLDLNGVINEKDIEIFAEIMADLLAESE